MSDPIKSPEMDLVKLNGFISVTLASLYYTCTDGQIVPDGRNCTICGDIDHQAMECRFNAFKIFMHIVEKFPDPRKELNKL